MKNPIFEKWYKFFLESQCLGCEGSGCSMCRYTGEVLCDDSDIIESEELDSSDLLLLFQEFYKEKPQIGLH